MTDRPTHIYYGRRALHLTEIGDHLDIYPGKYLITPIGEKDWDAIGVSSKKDMKVVLRELREAYPEAIFINI